MLDTFRKKERTKMKTISSRRSLVTGMIILFVGAFAVSNIYGADPPRVYPIAFEAVPIAVSNQGAFVVVACSDRDDYGSIGLRAKIKVDPTVWWTWWEDLPPGGEDDVLCYIGNLPGGNSVSEIDVNSILLNGIVPITVGSDTLLSCYPEFVDSVLRVGFNKREALLSLNLKGKDSSLKHVVTVEGSLPAEGSGFLGLARVTVKSLKPFPENGIEKANSGTPPAFELLQNHPNPFNPETEISYVLPKDAYVNLSIYNILGQKVRTLVDELETAGRKSVRWDGMDERGDQVTSGVYFYKIRAGDFEKTNRMFMLK
jgi:hypothetical protein